MILLTLFITLGFSIASIALGATELINKAVEETFIPLVGIPFVEREKVSSFGDYVNALYFASISIAAFLAVVKIIFSGVKYMLSDVVTNKADAKKDIKGALIGLLIVIGAVLILNTINPNLSKINLFGDAPIPVIGDLVDYVEEEECPIKSPNGSCVTPITCKDTETLNTHFDTEGNVSYTCTPNTAPPRDDPPNTTSIILTYTCLNSLNPNGCSMAHQFNKSDAEAKCDRIAEEESIDGTSQLVDDPTTLGQGICYYVPK